ncbi:MAG: ribokinase [Clostridia bacterium]|nr:ribokinase [Clostridia bacterium]
MKQYDLMIIGPATRDVNVDYTGAEDRSVGGAVTFCTAAAKAANPRVFAAVKIAAEDSDIIDVFKMDTEDIALLKSEKTTVMHNKYFTADRERRQSGCPAQSDPILPDEIPAVPCRMYHLAGLLFGDFPNELLEDLHAKGKLAADAQGFLRHNENGTLTFHDWAEKKKYLPYLDFLKTDALEAEILTGCADRAEAAKLLNEWGAKEVMVSHNSEIMVYDGNKVYTCPIKARNLSGRTGRGDTTTGSYLAKRMAGASIEDALQYATACVSLKMETPGVFSGTAEDVEAYIKEFYC